jgi:FtsP/CotA-like multicopper oxidase with cupredoxin domain
MVINGQFPGPLIEANEGDTIVVNVHNEMSNGTGIRKHSCHFSVPLRIPHDPSFSNRLA